MKAFVLRILRLIFGLLLFAIGVVLTISANIGYAPWDVFHVGLSITTGLSIGIASIITGLAIVIIVTIAGEKIGIGTLANIILIGIFIDLIIFLDFIPIAESIVIGITMLLIGIFIISLGSYFYIKSAFGAGPRDNLMVVLNRKTKLPVGVCRGIVELTATVAGWFLGGMVGIGTIIFVVAIGFFIQTTFAIFKFKAAEVKHENILQTYKALRDAIQKNTIKL